jgi:peptide/nickel transport system permease protein
MIGETLKNKKKTSLKPKVKYIRLYRQFKIFYRNLYGRIGLIILIGFIVITLLTPVIVIDPNYGAIAPVIDTSSPQLEYISNLSSHYNSSLSNSSLYFIPTSDTNSIGASQLLLNSQKGNLYSICIDAQNTSNNNKLYEIYSPNSSNGLRMAADPVISTLQDCTFISRGILKLTNFVFLPMSNGNIVVGQDGATSYSPIHPTFKMLYNISYNGTLASQLVVNSLPYIYFLENNPSYNYEDVGAAFQGQMFFINQYKNNLTLHDYSIFPQSELWKNVLPLKGDVGLSFLGSGFTPSQYYNYSEVLVYNDTSIFAYNSTDGEILWHISNGLNLSLNNGLNIPIGQQENYYGDNYAFFVNSNMSLEKLDLLNGELTNIYTANSTICSISSTDGHGSFPSGVILTTGKSFIILHGNSNTNISSIMTPIPTTVGKVNGEGTYSGAYNMIFVSQNGYVISVNTSAISPSGTFLWSFKLTHPAASFSSPNLILNGQTGNLQIGVVSSNYYFYLVSALAVDNNPIPPTLTSTTGEPFPLGTEYQGYNVWSEFIGSFWVDWEFGLIIGLYTIGLAVIIAMYVGYKGGIGGGIIETISLGIYLTPSLGLLIALTDFFPANQRFIDIILVIGGLSWPFAAFTLMAIVKSVKTRTYIEASRMLGSSTFTILRKDVLPNLGPLLLYMLSLSIAGGAAAVSSLQFLGIARLTLPTWGGMLSSVLNNFSYTVSAPFWVYPPVIALTMFVFSFILVSRGMDELTNPRLRRR